MKTKAASIVAMAIGVIVIAAVICPMTNTDNNTAGSAQVLIGGEVTLEAQRDAILESDEFIPPPDEE